MSFDADVCRRLPLADATLRLLDTWPADRLRAHLETVLGSAWNEWWLTSPKRKMSPPTKTEYLAGGHRSVYKIVRGRRRTKPEPPDRDPAKTVKAVGF